jgi:hypothetical protein
MMTLELTNEKNEGMSGSAEDMDDIIVPGSALDNFAALFGPGFVHSRSRYWKAFAEIPYFTIWGRQLRGSRY